MTKKDKAYLVECLTHICASLAAVISIFEESADSRPKPATDPPAVPELEETPPTPAELPLLQPLSEPQPEPTPATPTAAPAKPVTYEEVRAVLADKSRTGYRAEVKALLTAHGVRQLSEITDPAVYAELIREAEEIGNG